MTQAELRRLGKCSKIVLMSPGANSVTNVQLLLSLHLFSERKSKTANNAIGPNKTRIR